MLRALVQKVEYHLLKVRFYVFVVVVTGFWWIAAANSSIKIMNRDGKS